jgi:hypothetical protein
MLQTKFPQIGSLHICIAFILELPAVVLHLRTIQHLYAFRHLIRIIIIDYFTLANPCYKFLYII